MHHRLFRLGIVCAAAIVIAAGPAPAQVSDDYKPLEAKYLRGPLAPYWATGVAFLDTVVKPGGTETLKHGRKRYVRFETKVVGACYIDADLGARLKDLQAGRSFVFTGTVLQKEKGFFSFGEPEYFIAIMGLQSALGETADIPDQIARFNLPTNSADALMLSNLGVLLRDLQTEIAVMARARGVEPWELLDASNTNRPAAELMISSSLSSYSSTIKVAEEDILGQLLLSLIAARVQPVAAPPVPLAASNAMPKAAVKTPPADLQPEADTPAPAAGVPAQATDDEAARKAAEKQAAEQAAQAKKVEAEKKRQEKLAAEKAEADRLAAEKKAREEKEKMEELQAAQAKQAQAEKQRLERERVAAEKKAAEEKARLAREQESREREARLAAEKKAKEEAEAARKAAAPKLRVTPRTDVDAPVPAAAEPKPVQPAAKIQPVTPAETKPAPTPAPKPAAGGDDPDAPVPF